MQQFCFFLLLKFFYKFVCCLLVQLRTIFPTLMGYNHNGAVIVSFTCYIGFFEIVLRKHKTKISLCTTADLFKFWVVVHFTVSILTICNYVAWWNNAEKCVRAKYNQFLIWRVDFCSSFLLWSWMKYQIKIKDILYIKLKRTNYCIFCSVFAFSNYIFKST